MNPQLLRPAVANALWRGLKEQAWLSDYASNSPRPLPPEQIRTTTPAPESPEARWEPVNGRLYAFARRSASKIGVAFTVTLLRDDHDGLVEMLDWKYRRAYKDALEQATCQRPFYRDEKSATGWYRNWNDPALSELAAKVLMILAGLAVVELIPPDIEAALIGDLHLSKVEGLESLLR